jgi:hypothetical protein
MPVDDAQQATPDDVVCRREAKTPWPGASTPVTRLEGGPRGGRAHVENRCSTRLDLFWLDPRRAVRGPARKSVVAVIPGHVAAVRGWFAGHGCVNHLRFLGRREVHGSATVGRGELQQHRCNLPRHSRADHSERADFMRS